MAALKVINPDSSSQTPPSYEGSSLKEKRIQRTAYYEKIWLTRPESFDNLNTSIGRNRFERFKQLVTKFFPNKQGRACNLGLGVGTIAAWLAGQGFRVDGVDISSRAIELLKAKKIANLDLFQQCIPYTHLDDDTYDLVVCTDLIANLEPTEYRLLFSELSRLVSQNGYALCSTPLELKSEDALTRFLELADTELEIVGQSYAYDLLFIRISDGLAYSRRLARAASDHLYRKESIVNRRGFGRWFFSALSRPFLSPVWKIISYLVNPLSRFWDNSDGIRNGMEKITHFFWQENGITHAMVLGKRRSLLNTDSKEVPHDVQLQKGKRSVWE